MNTIVGGFSFSIFCLKKKHLPDVNIYVNVISSTKKCQRKILVTMIYAKRLKKKNAIKKYFLIPQLGTIELLNQMDNDRKMRVLYK